MTTKATTKKATRAKAVPELQPVDSADSPVPSATGYVVAKAVNLNQLTDELRAQAPDHKVNLTLTSTENSDSSRTDVLWVTPAGISAEVVSQTVASHEPDPTYGIPQVMQDFGVVMSKIRENPDGPITDAERDTLIKGMALTLGAGLPNG